VTAVRWNREVYYCIISAIFTDAERNVACRILQNEENWVFTRWFYTFLKMLKLVKEHFLKNPSFLEEILIAPIGTLF
jgi:hypothetical protein